MTTTNTHLPPVVLSGPPENYRVEIKFIDHAHGGFEVSTACDPYAFISVLECAEATPCRCAEATEDEIDANESGVYTCPSCRADDLIRRVFDIGLRTANQMECTQSDE